MLKEITAYELQVLFDSYNSTSCKNMPETIYEIHEHI